MITTNDVSRTEAEPMAAKWLDALIHASSQVGRLQAEQSLCRGSGCIEHYSQRIGRQLDARDAARQHVLDALDGA